MSVRITALRPPCSKPNATVGPQSCGSATGRMRIASRPEARPGAEAQRERLELRAHEHASLRHDDRAVQAVLALERRVFAVDDRLPARVPGLVEHEPPAARALDLRVEPVGRLAALEDA